MTEITIFRDKFAKGWPRHEHGERGYVLELGRALEREYSTDAHFTAYRSANDRRLVREAIDQLDGVEITAIVLDVDCPATHGTKEPAPDPWRVELREKVWALSEIHPDPFYYETRGGARIVYTQEEPTILRTQADAQNWSQVYAVAVAHLEHAFGIVADPACADWQRFYRLPHATRDGAGEPEKWLKIGNANRIGSLLIDATHADVAAAKRKSKAFAQRQVLNFAPSSAGGDGLLYHLLRASGGLIREHGSGAFVIRCPAEREHTTGRTGDGSTLLYLPAVGKELGAIHCLHGHCAGRSAKEWLRMFSDSELEAARRAAGIERDRKSA